MTTEGSPQTSARARFRAEVKRSTRVTGISAGLIALVAYPGWTAFDYLVEPDVAPDLLLVRLAVTVPILLITLSLIFNEAGHSQPELHILAICLVINTGIAVMITDIETHYAAYALGLSLTVYAGAFLLIWSPLYMAALCALSLAILAVVLGLADPVGSAALGTVFFYFGTACALSLVGQLHRERLAWAEFQTRDALEREQERSSALVSELNRQSHEDSLTGLANRRAWDEALGRECARVGRDGTDLAVLLCDLDQLKEVNDRLGHAVGDVVLRTIGGLLDERARDADLVARIGGDEFAVLLPGAGLLGATELAERLRSLVESESTAAAGIGGLTISVGVADWEGPDDSPETIMLRADRRLYTAKSSRNVVCAGDPPRA